MRKFNLVAGIAHEHFELNYVRDVFFNSTDEALKEAKEFAEELYYLNPKRDMVEIAKENKGALDDDVFFVFKLEMFRQIAWSVEELLEHNGVVVEKIVTVGKKHE